MPLSLEEETAAARAELQRLRLAKTELPAQTTSLPKPVVPRYEPTEGNLIRSAEAGGALLELPTPIMPIPEAPDPPVAPPSIPVIPSEVPPDPATVALEVDERLDSLKRSYQGRLVAMAAAFRDLPKKLSEDEALASLRLCDAGEEDVRERAFDIFAEALSSSQEHQIRELQQKLAEKESEEARLGRQLGALVSEQKAGTDPPGLRLRAADKELATSRARLVELEEFYRVSSARQAALVERANTLEEETLHWRAKCAPLRDRCSELELEMGAIRAGRAEEFAIVEEAKRVRAESEAAVIAARALADGANEAAREARDQAVRAVADSEGRWLHQTLSVWLSRLFDVLPIEEATQQALYAAGDGEAMTRAGEALVSEVAAYVTSLEARLATSDVALAEASALAASNSDELERARTTASMSAEHAHHLVERTLEAEREKHAREIAIACEAADKAREAAEAEVAALRQAASDSAEAHVTGLVKAQSQHDAALDARAQQYAKDMRTLVASYRDTREELNVQGDQLRDARKKKADAERALQQGLEEARSRIEATETRLREQSYLAAHLAGHASSALQQEMLAIFGAADMIAAASASAHGSRGVPATPATSHGGHMTMAAGLSLAGRSSLGATAHATPDQQRHAVESEAAVLLAGIGPHAIDSSFGGVPAVASMASAMASAERSPAGGDLQIQTVAGGIPASRRAPVLSTV